MEQTYKFNYKKLLDLKNEINRLGLEIPVEEDFEVLKDTVETGSSMIPNRLAIHPMEGADANPDGTPSELTFRRYERYARGGAGLIWFEAMAINEKGRANQHQLFLNDDTVDDFKRLVDMVRQKSRESYGESFNPYLVIQLTHVGRFGQHKKILYHYDQIDKAPAANIPDNHPLMEDSELVELEEHFLKAAKLAKRAGFDAVDVKACHRYLLSENLAAHIRDDNYGGSYENRTRLMKNAIQKIKDEVEIDLATRLNIYDAIPYPYGWGTDKDGNEDHEEPKKLIADLTAMGVKIINITAGTPYLFPHINRPYSHPSNIGYNPPEHPLIGVERLIRLARITQNVSPRCIVVGTGYSYLRQFAPYVAAGVIKNGWSTLIGFGRQAFAYPDFPKDIIEGNGMKKEKVCIACSKCAELKAKKQHSGCVIKDQEIYLPIYKKLLEQYN